MKIGILTYTREYANLGTNMQCYCTLKAVQEACPNAQVELADYASAAPARRPYLSDMSLQSVKNDCIRIRKYDRFFRQELKFSGEAVTTNRVGRALDFLQRQRYDAVYVGSDTVLEMKGAEADEITPYWLDGRIPGTKVLAAASSHNVTAEGLSARQRYLIERAIDGFSLLGVRDDATFRLLAHFTGPADSRLRMIPDPTFTYEIDYRHIERYLERKNLRFSAPVVCLHLLRNTAWAPKLAELFRKAGYVVASLRPARYADLIFTDLSPFEQLGLYKYFTLVITHRFHDTIFCLKNLTPVLAFPEHASDVTAQGESKIATLLRGFGLNGAHYLPNDEELTAENLFARHRAAIAEFGEKRAQLQAALAEHRERYRAFIRQSRTLLQ